MYTALLLIPLQLLFRDILSHFVQNFFLIEWKLKEKFASGKGHDELWNNELGFMCAVHGVPDAIVKKVALI